MLRTRLKMDNLFEHVEMDAISYIRARDPSIQALNIPRRFDQARNRLFQFNEENDIQEEVEHLQVYLRIKKAADITEYYEILDDEVLLCKVPEDAQCIRNFRNEKISKKFTFSKIFSPDSRQIDIFNGVVKEKVLRFINGQNCSVLTYGASGSGKTFTILGTDEEPGIIPRALEYLFRTLPTLPEQTSVKPLQPGVMVRLNESTCKSERDAVKQIINSVTDRKTHYETYRAMQKRLSSESVAVIDEMENVSLGVWVTFAEIYNEQIYDLLIPQPPRGKSRQKLCLGNSKGTTYIKNLTAVNVTSGLEAFLVLQYGQQNLQYAETQLNSHSSRSHCIFTIKLVQNLEGSVGTTVSQFNFCDLAGSERVKKTMNVGDRLKESNNINQSLLVLGKCISTVRDMQKTNNDNKIVPFRESKLTQLFQKALSGQEPISLIVNINPSRSMFDESLHVLNFSAIAKDIIVEKPILRNERRNSRFSQYLQARSTAVVPTYNQDDPEKEELKSIILQLQAELQINEEEYDQERCKIISGYQEIIADKEKFHEQHIKRILQMEENKRKILEFEVEKLQDLLRESRKDCNVIDLTADDEIECLKEELDDYKDKLFEAEQKLLEEKHEVDNLSKQLRSKEEEIVSLKHEIKELQKTLEDAKHIYEQSQEKYSNRVAEIIQLQDENLQLKAALREPIYYSGSSNDEDI